jgi:hypothetical protein
MQILIDNPRTPKENIERVLKGLPVDTIPFTMYENKIAPCKAEREMRNRGLCIVNRKNVFHTLYPNVKIHQEILFQQDENIIKTFYKTPVGTVETLQKTKGGFTWLVEKMFKNTNDYKVIEFIIRDQVYIEDYNSFANAEKSSGGDMIFRASFGLEPLQEFISGIYMDIHTFCIEWMENRDEILKLYEIIVEKRRSIYPIIANSPALHANYGGNIVPEIIGLKNFRNYYIQHYNEAAEVMHKKEKLIGSHFDGNCKLLSDAIASTHLDYIEAFTPSPDTDMSLKEAADKWSDKVIWVNFPSSLHLQSDDVVYNHTVEMLSELSSVDKIIMGITEDVPSYRWQQSCLAIMNGLDKVNKIFLNN